MTHIALIAGLRRGLRRVRSDRRCGRPDPVRAAGEAPRRSPASRHWCTCCQKSRYVPWSNPGTYLDFWQQVHQWRDAGDRLGASPAARTGSGRPHRRSERTRLSPRRRPAMSAMWVIAKLSLRQVARRRGVVLLLIALPLSFYLVRRDLQGQFIRFLALGLGWAVSTVTLFASTSARWVDRRLCVAGFRPGQLLGGRVLAMVLCGLVLAGADGLLVWFAQDVGRQWAVILLLVTTV